VDWHQASHLVFMELVIPFLFSFNPKSVFKWTARNNYNQLCEGGRIALGGGGQKVNFGLCMEDCFHRGVSAIFILFLISVFSHNKKLDFK
jgi:hypothetical protein